MADYFPLISRAVQTLDPNTPQRREAIYARARDALERQLRALAPPIAEGDLAREKAVLESTIRRVESQFSPAPPINTDVEPPAAFASEPAAAISEPKFDEARAEFASDEQEAVAAVQRPRVTQPATRGFLGDKRKKTAAVVAFPIVALIAVAAYVLRDDPSRYSQQGAVAQADSVLSPTRKNEGRLDGTGANSPSTSLRTPAPQPDLPVASRVLFFEETPNNPQGAQSDGLAVWRVENLAGGTGKPLTMAVRGSIAIPNAKIGLEFVIKKNTDAALPASHTLELAFKPEGDREGIKEISQIELRDQENQPGFPLQGAMVPVGVNLFLIGLDRTDIILAKNTEALRDRKWFAFQLRFVNGRLGAILIEKGASGDRAIREALDAWR